MDEALASTRFRTFVIGLAMGALAAFCYWPATPGALMASVTTAVRPARFATSHLMRSAVAAVSRASGPKIVSVGRAAFHAAALAHPVKPLLAARPALPEPTAPVTPSFAWPVDGEISSCYGERWGRIHVGVDVAAMDGQPVRAALAGRVVYSGSLPGYGNLLLLEHAGGWYTVYGHNQRHLVEATGDGRALVEAGQTIALVGRTGNATGPHVHFEIRKGIDAVDPLTALPARIQTALR